MRALCTTEREPYVALAEVDPPRVDRGEALVEVRAVSLNRGETAILPQGWDVRDDGSTASLGLGFVPGWDLAGVVAEPAADGSGPAPGTRVVGLVRRGAWAELAAVPVSHLAPIPDGVTFEQASTLPVAGLTALCALRRAGLLQGKRVLVTGAAGGVGRFGVQLAHMGGAHVTAVARDDVRAAGLDDLGADRVISELDVEGDRFDVILECVGGSSLGAAMGRIAPNGRLILYGNASSAPVTLETARFWPAAPGSLLYNFLLFPELQRESSAVTDLAILLDLLAAGRLQTDIATVESWRTPGPSIRALLERRVNGKAVLVID